MTPRGIEILVKKASVDGAFKRHLLAERSGAAERIGLELDPAEAAMLDTFPEAHLDKIIAETLVEPKLRSTFMGYSAEAMLVTPSGSPLSTKAAEETVKYLNHTYDKTGLPFVDFGSNIYFAPGDGLIVSAGIRPEKYPYGIESGYPAPANLSSVICNGINLYIDTIDNIHDTLVDKNGNIYKGSVWYKFIVNETGIVSNIEVIRSTIVYEELVDAVTDNIHTWRFPPIDENKVAVIYQANFEK